MEQHVSAGGKSTWGRYAVLALCIATTTALPAQTLSTLHDFDGKDGGFPQAGLIGTFTERRIPAGLAAHSVVVARFLE